MTQIGYTCPLHGNVIVEPDMITLYDDHYTAWCPQGHGNEKEMDPTIRGLLLSVGVKTEDEKVAEMLEEIV